MLVRLANYIKKIHSNIEPAAQQYLHCFNGDPLAPLKTTCNQQFNESNLTKNLQELSCEVFKVFKVTLCSIRIS